MRDRNRDSHELRHLARKERPDDSTVIDGPKYVVVIDHLLGIIYRIRKPRVGLMRFSR